MSISVLETLTIGHFWSIDWSLVFKAVCQVLNRSHFLIQWIVVSPIMLLKSVQVSIATVQILQTEQTVKKSKLAKMCICLRLNSVISDIKMYIKTWSFCPTGKQWIGPLAARDNKRVPDLFMKQTWRMGVVSSNSYVFSLSGPSYPNISSCLN